MRVFTNCVVLLAAAVMSSAVMSSAGVDFVRPASAADALAAQGPSKLIRSARSGSWSDTQTWEAGAVPPAGSQVQIQAGHTVIYDVKSEETIRSIHVAGTLRFAHDRDTRLDVGLIKIQAGDDPSEEGFDCDSHLSQVDVSVPKPALEVGLPEQPIDARFKALICLHRVEGLDPQSCPAIVCCAGRIDLHGAPLEHTWCKLGETAARGASQIVAGDSLSGWKAGDQVIVTVTDRNDSQDETLQTEVRTVTGIDGQRLTLDRPLEREHVGIGDYRGEIANLSRNVVIESADPQGVRGHTMYHRNSAGSISYAELRHLGKQGVLGRYRLHYHLVGDTMRGSQVVGASIWDSHNRWLTIHGTNYLVVRDCVGFGSVGHGFFLEDGTEVYNVLTHNLAVGARPGKPLPKQVLPFDANEGAGFWWANSRNTFTANVATENGGYGFRFEAIASSGFSPTLSVLQPDGRRQPVNIRTLPFVRFDDNESHSSVGLYGLNLGEGVNRVGPDSRHPFIVRNLKVWDTHYAVRPQVPSLLIEGMQIHNAQYGIYHPNFENHVYRDVLISHTNTEPFNRGHDDDSAQYGVLTVDGLTFADIGSGDSMPLIQISDHNMTGRAESHFRNVSTQDWHGSKSRAVVDLGGGPRPQPKTERCVPVYMHDWFGPGRTAKIVSVKARELKSDGLPYRDEPLLTGRESRVAEVGATPFPTPLDPVDDLPPTTAIVRVTKLGADRYLVRGMSADNGAIERVTVNGAAAKSMAPNFSEWEATVNVAAANDAALTALSEDASGNVEKMPHVVPLRDIRLINSR